MQNLKLDYRRIHPFISEKEYKQMGEEVRTAQKILYDGSGEGNDFLGWLQLPSKIKDEELAAMERDLVLLRKKSDILVVVGIGGSYLGAKAVNDALSHTFSHLRKVNNPLMIFAGHNIGEDYMHELSEILDKHDYSIVVISKSGTTTEPALAFRILKNHLTKKVGSQEAVQRIIAITDQSRGALRQLSEEEGYKTFVIPDDIGGRFSVLTPVGLVPLAICGTDIRQLVKGARDMEKLCDPGNGLENNPAVLYAAARNALYRSGKKIEILVNYHHKLHYFSEWWKQLFGESEGKELKGIFPASVDNSTDLHSMGQYIQEGERILFETVISVAGQQHKMTIPRDSKDPDKLNYLAGRHIDHVNKMAELGTALAHVDGGVPNIRIEIPEINAYYIGQLIYFFENACGISGYLLGINPFNQPGVEAYKKNMFALLEKPGFEDETRKIKLKL
ncbi:MAG TPA: glucose-6-phosphate isomerase [Bacteroidaceae bacterium]|nr:glucose-6-phosphate isomerase [Bacteroidaceae bacterium]